MLVVGLFLFRNTSDDSTPNTVGNVTSSYRYTAYSEISMLIEKEDYTRALTYIVEAESSLVITNPPIENQIMVNNDTVSTSLYELKWLKAQALVGLARTNEAKSILNEIKNVKGKFQDDIDSLLNKLQTMK